MPGPFVEFESCACASAGMEFAGPAEAKANRRTVCRSMDRSWRVISCVSKPRIPTKRFRRPGDRSEAGRRLPGRPSHLSEDQQPGDGFRAFPARVPAPLLAGCLARPAWPGPGPGDGERPRDRRWGGVTSRDPTRGRGRRGARDRVPSVRRGRRDRSRFGTGRLRCPRRNTPWGRSARSASPFRR